MIQKILEIERFLPGCFVVNGFFLLEIEKLCDWHSGRSGRGYCAQV
jgi:hypothetical protein